MAKAKKEEKASEPTIKDVLSAIVELNENLNKIAEGLKPREVTVEVKQEVPAPVVEAPKPVAPQFPIPPEFREVVDAHLNKRFGIEIDYKSDSAAFGFSILVPKEYSEASPSYWATHHEDRRTKVILNALGSNGVRDWAQKVFESFSPEMKAKITFDRSNLN